MKLPIARKWFEKILSGEKKIEMRDAHITFVEIDEVGKPTGRTCLRYIRMANCQTIEATCSALGLWKKEAKREGLFEDDRQVWFHIYEKKKEDGKR